MRKSTGGGGSAAFAMAGLLLSIAVVVFIFIQQQTQKSKGESRSRTTTSSKSPGSSSVVVSNSSPLPSFSFDAVSVRVNSENSLTITIRITGDIPETVTLEIFSQMSPTTAPTNAITIPAQAMMGYTWTLVSSPSLSKDRAHYLRVTSGSTSSSLVQFTLNNVLAGCVTSADNDNDDENDMSAAERRLRQVILFIGPILIGLVIEQSISKLIKFAVDPEGQTKAIRELINGTSKNSTLKKELASTTEKFLIKRNLKFKILRLLSVMSPVQIKRLGASLNKHLDKLERTDPDAYRTALDELWRDAERGRGAIQVADKAREAERITEEVRRSQRYAARASRAASRFDIFSLAVAVTGIAMDVTNFQGMLNIDEQTTGKLLRIRQNEIIKMKQDVQQSFTDLNLPIPNDPAIYFNAAGPLLKYEADVIQELLTGITMELIMLPCTDGTGITPTNLESRYLTMFNGEQSRQIQKIREIQNRVFRTYYLKVQCLPPRETCSLEGVSDTTTPSGTFIVSTNYDTIVASSGFIIYEYRPVPSDFAPRASIMFDNTIGLPIQTGIYLQINNRHVVYVSGYQMCTESKVLLGGYFVDGLGYKADIPDDLGGVINSVKLGRFVEARPSCTSPLPIPSPIPIGCLSELFASSIAELTDSEKEDLQEIAYEFLCKQEGGKWLGTTGQCSYRTASECNNSYPWPLPLPSEGENAPDQINVSGTAANSVCVFKNDVFILDQPNNRIMRLKDNPTSPVPTKNPSTWASPTPVQFSQSPFSPVSSFQITNPVCITSYDSVMYIAQQSGQISKVTNINSTSPIVIPNWLNIGSSSPGGVTTSIRAMYVRDLRLFIAFSDKVIAVSTRTGRVISDKLLKSPDGLINFQVNNPTSIYVSRDETMFIAQGNKVSRITNVLYSGTPVVTENWFSSVTGSTVTSSVSITPSSILVHDSDMYVSSNDKIIKISNCYTTVGSSDVKVDWATSQDASLTFSGQTINHIARFNRDMLVFTTPASSSITRIKNVFPWDKNNYGEKPIDIEDVTYAEWRTDLEHLRRDLGVDLTGDPGARGGVCVAWDPSHRFVCENIKKDFGLTGVTKIGTCAYNTLTGECTNTEQFCDAYGMAYDESRPVSQLLDTTQSLSLGFVDIPILQGGDTSSINASGALPTCYLHPAQAFFADNFVGRVLVQFITQFVDVAISPAFSANIIAQMLYGLGFGPNDNSPGAILAQAAAGSVGTYIAQLVLEAALARRNEPFPRTLNCQCKYQRGGSDEGWFTQYYELRDACINERASKTNMTVVNLSGGPCPAGYIRDWSGTMCHLIITDSSGGCDDRNPRVWDNGFLGGIDEQVSGMTVSDSLYQFCTVDGRGARWTQWGPCELLPGRSTIDSCEYTNTADRTGNLNGQQSRRLVVDNTSDPNRVCPQWIRDDLANWGRSLETKHCVVNNHPDCSRGLASDGSVCNIDSDCNSGNCVSNRCGPGITRQGSPCSRPGQCISKNCARDYTALPPGTIDNRVGVCSIGLSQIGDPCTINETCKTSTCTSGTCAPAPTGVLCTTTSDCSTGLVCGTSNRCEAPIASLYRSPCVDSNDCRTTTTGYVCNRQKQCVPSSECSVM